MPIFIKEEKIIYFSHIPKCGGMAVEEMLSHHVSTVFKTPKLHGNSQLKFPCSPQHFQLKVIEEIFPLNNFSYLFSVVRDPIARFISEYKFLMSMNVRNKKPIIPFNEWASMHLDFYEINQYHLDNHFRPQVEFISEKFDIFKLEDGFENIVKRLSSELHIPLKELKIKHTNKSMNIKVDAIDINVKQRLYKLYDNDYKMFNYEKK